MPDQRGPLVSLPVDPAADVVRRRVVTLTPAGCRLAGPRDTTPEVGIAGTDSAVGESEEIDVHVLSGEVVAVEGVGPLRPGDDVQVTALGRVRRHAGLDEAVVGAWVAPRVELGARGMGAVVTRQYA